MLKSKFTAFFHIFLQNFSEVQTFKQIVILTGASSGIGKTIAKELA